MHLAPGIDPDGTPSSKFINDIMLKILQEVPNPDGEPKEGLNEQEQAGIILGALVSINAGVIANVLADPEDHLIAFGVVAQIANETMQELARLRPQMVAARGAKQ